jgi:cytochrome c-type biogenesis protein CcmH/NrfF
MLVLTTAVVAAQQVDSRVVEEKIYCPCGCGEILVNCHCETAVSTRTQIQNRLMAGVSPETIVDDFVTLYGSTILVNEDMEKIKAASKSSSFDMFPLYVLGIVVAAFVAYHFGKASSRSKKKEEWKLEKGGKK